MVFKRSFCSHYAVVANNARLHAKPTLDLGHFKQNNSCSMEAESEEAQKVLDLQNAYCIFCRPDLVAVLKASPKYILSKQELA